MSLCGKAGRAGNGVKRVTKWAVRQTRYRRTQHEVRNSGKIPVDAANALPNRPPVIGKTAERAARLRSSPLPFSSRSAADLRQDSGLSLNPRPGTTHSETVVVGGDA